MALRSSRATVGPGLGWREKIAILAGRYVAFRWQRSARPTIHYRVRPGRNQLAARCELGPEQLSEEFRDLKFGKFKLGLSLLQSPAWSRVLEEFELLRKAATPRLGRR